jgi:hypothetical protein
VKVGGTVNSGIGGTSDKTDKETYDFVDEGVD